MKMVSEKLPKEQLQLQENGIGHFKDGSPEKPKKIGVFMATLFVSGENAGCALLALPYAMVGTGWAGLAMIIICCIDAAYAGVVLAKSWLILEERWEEYQGECRYPYPAIGLMAFGPKMRIAVSFCLQATLFGASVVYLLICAEIFNSLLVEKTGICLCTWIIIIAAILTPLTWFGTPSELWFAAPLALLTTAVAAVLILVNMVIDIKSEIHSPVNHPPPTVEAFFLAFGTILFAYGGTAAFPTYQNDMKEKEKFPKSVVMGFLILVSLYLPLSLTGYLAYGDIVKPDILLTVSRGGLSIAAQILIAGHLFFGFLLIVNPYQQELEAIFKIPQDFTWKRIVLRTGVMVALVFVAESIPHFGKILDLFGGSTVTMLTFIFPPLFYIKLTNMKGPYWPQRKIGIMSKLFMYQIILVGIIGGIACTYAAVKSIVSPDAFVPPCYINATCHCK